MRNMTWLNQKLANQTLLAIFGIIAVPSIGILLAIILVALGIIPTGPEFVPLPVNP